MDFEEQMQGHASKSEDSGETSCRRHDIVPPLLTMSEQDESSFEHNEQFHELLESFYGLMLNSSTLLNCKDSRVANPVMIHIPDHLVGFCNVGLVGEKTLESADYEIQPSAHGPLSYIAGYVMSKLNKASKGKSEEEKPELQALLQSLIVSEEEVSNEFISAKTRDGLVTPCQDSVRNLHKAEICF
ncbi:Hypothetical predicted protein [Paramuricea clavata]|nr:Hypothetical predicted protein [Paramuricea clavata]